MSVFLTYSLSNVLLLLQESDIERALCHQFEVTEARLLGFGNMRHLVDAAEKPGKHQSKDYRILYETAFCGKTRWVCFCYRILGFFTSLLSVVKSGGFFQL